MVSYDAAFDVDKKWFFRTSPPERPGERPREFSRRQ